jgi:hypothetical protein
METKEAQEVKEHTGDHTASKWQFVFAETLETIALYTTHFFFKSGELKIFPFCYFISRSKCLSGKMSEYKYQWLLKCDITSELTPHWKKELIVHDSSKMFSLDQGSSKETPKEF